MKRTMKPKKYNPVAKSLADAAFRPRRTKNKKKEYKRLTKKDVINMFKDWVPWRLAD